MQKRIFIILIVATALYVIGRVFLFHENQSVAPTSHAPPIAPQATDEQTIRDLIAQFGEKLRMVSLAAPKELLVKEIEEHYSSFVSENLLSAWRANPERAPGKSTSNPWPKSIEILLVEPGDDGSYEVQGKVVEVTSVENMSGGSASEYPVALKLRNQNGEWVITGFTKMMLQ